MYAVIPVLVLVKLNIQVNPRFYKREVTSYYLIIPHCREKFTEIEQNSKILGEKLDNRAKIRDRSDEICSCPFSKPPSSLYLMPLI